MLSVGNATRKFVMDIGGKERILADPNPNLAPAEVASFYAPSYPELTNANVIGPTPDGDAVRYDFKNVIGTKG